MKLYLCLILSVFFHGMWLVFFVFDNNKKTYTQNTVVNVEVVDDKSFFKLAHNLPILAKKIPKNVLLENNIKKNYKLIWNKKFENNKKNLRKSSLTNGDDETKHLSLFKTFKLERQHIKRPTYFKMERENFIPKNVNLIDNSDNMKVKDFKSNYELFENRENNKKSERKINNIKNLDLKFSDVSKKIYLPQNNFKIKATTKDKYVFIWGEMIKQKILKNLNYPKTAKKNNLDGVVFLRLKVDESGNLISLDVLQSSGSEVLDKAAKKAATDANKFPIAPKEIRGNNFVFRLPVRFKI